MEWLALPAIPAAAGGADLGKPTELTGNRDVGDDVAAGDDANRGNRAARVRELRPRQAKDVRCQCGGDVGVLSLPEHADETAILVDEVRLIPETIRLPGDGPPGPKAHAPTPR